MGDNDGRYDVYWTAEKASQWPSRPPPPLFQVEVWFTKAVPVHGDCQSRASLSRQLLLLKGGHFDIFIKRVPLSIGFCQSSRDERLCSEPPHGTGRACCASDISAGGRAFRQSMREAG